MLQGTARAPAELSNPALSRSDFIRTLFRLLDENKTNYAVLHSYEGLPERLPSDLDMAIHPAGWGPVRRTFQALRARGYRPVQCLNYAVRSYYFVFTWPEDGSHASIAVDFTSEHREGKLVLSSGEFLVRGRRRRGEFWIPSSEAEFQYLLAKKVLKGGINAPQVERLAELVRELGRPAAEKIAERLFGRRHARYAVECCAAGSLAANLRKLRRLLWRRVLLRDPVNPIRYQITEAVRQVRRLLQPTGLFVAVLGPDGVGKSTVIASLRTAVGFCFRSDTLFHWRPRLLWSRNPEPVVEPHGRASFSRGRSMAHLTAHFVDDCLGYCALVQPKRARSSLVLFDRYFDDVVVDPKRYRYSGPALFARILRRLAPRPDLILILRASERAILSRKTELAPEELRRQLLAYETLGKGCERARFVDAGQSAEAVTRDAAEIVLSHLESRFLRAHSRWVEHPGGMDLEALLSFLQGDVSPETYRFAALPSRRMPRWLVPIDNSNVARNGLDIYTPWELHAKLYKFVLSRAAAASPALLAVKPLSISSRRLTGLKELAGRLTGEQNPVFALSVGAPGKYQKLTVQAMRSSGEVLGFAKIPMTEAAEERVRHEAEVLMKLRCSPQLAESVPNVLHASDWQDTFLLFQSPVTGQISPVQFSDVHAQFLEKLHRIDRRTESGSELIDQAGTEWDAAPEMEPSLREIGKEALAFCEELLDGARIHCALTHGDFAPWNTRVQNGMLDAFDWEAAELAPIWWDLFHFHTQTACLLKRSKSQLRIPPGQPIRRGAYLLYLLHSIVRILKEDGRRTQELPYRRRMLVRELSLASTSSTAAGDLGQEQEQCS